MFYILISIYHLNYFNLTRLISNSILNLLLNSVYNSSEYHFPKPQLFSQVSTQK